MGNYTVSENEYLSLGLCISRRLISYQVMVQEIQPFYSAWLKSPGPGVPQSLAHCPLINGSDLCDPTERENLPKMAHLIGMGCEFLKETVLEDSVYGVCVWHQNRSSGLYFFNYSPLKSILHTASLNSTHTLQGLLCTPSKG